MDLQNFFDSQLEHYMNKNALTVMFLAISTCLTQKVVLDINKTDVSFANALLSERRIAWRFP